MAETWSSFWDDPEVVARFASRDPDLRLQALLREIADPARLRVLDIGCAGGRNTLLLARAGCDVHALDLSPAMVAETRRRLAPLLGEEEASARIRQGQMNDLAHYRSESFDLVVGLGIFQQAHSLSEWHQAVAESVRVLRSGGRMLVAHFAPGTDLTGEGMEPVPGEPDLYEPRPGQRIVLLDAARLDALMASHGLEPPVPSETVRVAMPEGGRHVTVNALYRKLPPRA